MASEMPSRGHGSGHGFASSATSHPNQEAPLPPSQPLTRLTPCSRLLAGHDQALERECFRQAQRAQRHPRLRLLRVVLSASPAHALAARATRSRGANRQRSERVECRDFGPSFGGPLIHDGVCVRRLSGAFHHHAPGSTAELTQRLARETDVGRPAQPTLWRPWAAELSTAWRPCAMARRSRWSSWSRSPSGACALVAAWSRAD